MRVNYSSPDCYQLRSNNSGCESILSVNRKYHDSCLFNLFINDRCSTCYSNTDILRACSVVGEGRVKTLPGPGLQGGPPNKYFKPVLLLITVSDCVDK